MCSQHLQLKRVDLDRSLAKKKKKRKEKKKKKKKKYLPPSSNLEKPPDEKQLRFFMRPYGQHMKWLGIEVLEKMNSWVFLRCFISFVHAV